MLYLSLLWQSSGDRIADNAVGFILLLVGFVKEIVNVINIITLKS